MQDELLGGLILAAPVEVSLICEIGTWLKERKAEELGTLDWEAVGHCNRGARVTN